MSKLGGVVLTGFPSNEVARRVLARLLETERDADVVCIVPVRFMENAHEWMARRSDAERARVELIEGDAAAIDLGLSGAEYKALSERTRVIHHCAAVTYTGAPFSLAERVNVGATFEVLELARNAPKLERLVHWSTIAATWDHSGVVREDELIEPRSNRLAHTRYRAERLVRKAREEVPSIVLRPAMLVGDSQSGELSRIEGAHLLISGLLTAPKDVPLPRVGRGDAPLYVVPIDYAVEAGLAIARAPDTVGRTFHIVDSSPPTIHEALTMIAELVGKPPPRGGLPNQVAQFVLRLPGVASLVHAQRALVDEISRDVHYDDSNARAVLTRAGLSCPSFATYVSKLVTHVEKRKSDRPAPPSPVQTVAR